MFAEQVTSIEEQLGELVSQLDPGALDDGTAIALLSQLDHVERLAGAAKALTAASIEAGNAWRGHGHRDAIGFVADRTATPRSRVRDSLAVADGLASAPVLEHAFRQGTLTISQAADIAAALAEHPEVEAELVALASTATPRELKARCVEICAQGKGADDQHRRAKAERSVSSSVGRDGIWRMSVRLPIIDGALVDKALDFFQTEVFEQARKAGDRESFDAYRADALVALAHAAMGDPHDRRTGPNPTDPSDWTASAPAQESGTETGETRLSRKENKRRRRAKRSRSSVRHTIVVTVPHSLFQPGGLHAGEKCMIPGVGPVPASVVHELLEHDPIIKAVVTRGRDITAVATLTRTIKEDLRLAVLAATNLTCAVPGCCNTRFLQLDHELEFHKGGPTSYDNLRPLCTFHHNQRTRENYELRGKPGSYEWTAPDNKVLATDLVTTSPSLLDN